MKFLQSLLFVMAVFACNPAMAEDTDLRNSAETSAEASKDEATANDAKEVAEKVVEATVADGETLPEADKGAEDGVDDLGEASEVAMVIVKAFQDKNWAVVVGGILMLLIFLLNKMGVMAMLKLEGWKVAAFSVGLGVVSQVGVELFLSSGDWVMALAMGISNGLVATGFWELIKSPVKAVASPTEEAA